LEGIVLVWEGPAPGRRVSGDARFLVQRGLGGFFFVRGSVTFRLEAKEKGRMLGSDIRNKVFCLCQLIDCTPGKLGGRANPRE